MRLTAAKQHSIRHNAGAPSAFFQHPQEKRKEQQFRLFRVRNSLQVIVDAFRVNRPLERRICKAD